MRIVIFGVSGRTGKHLAEQALAAGHSVVGLVRPARASGISHPSFAESEGDVLDYGTVERTLHGADGVLCALGHRGPFSRSFLPEAARNISMAMERFSIMRVVTVASAGILDEAGLPGALINTLLHSSAVDHRRTLEVYRKSALDWTVVRALKLTNGTRKGTYRVSRKAMPERGLFISRPDLAHFMLRCLVEGIYSRSSPGVAY